MDKLLSSFEVEALEGQAQPVDLVAALPVNMHRVPGFCLRQLQLIPLVLILKIWRVDSQSESFKRQAPGREVGYADIVPSDCGKHPAGFQTVPRADIAPTSANA